VAGERPEKAEMRKRITAADAARVRSGRGRFPGSPRAPPHEGQRQDEANTHAQVWFGLG
jgi:hypothetical protein